MLLGIVIGPQVLDIAESDPFVDFFSNLGLGMLFFFAGYEIDFERIRGAPLRLGALGWLLSLVLAYAIGGLLAAAGVVALVPLHRLGAGHDRDRHADPDPPRRGRAADPLRHLPARGRRRRRVRPDPARHAGPLDRAPAARGADPARLRGARGGASDRLGALDWRGSGPFERTLETSSQLAIRIAVVLVFGLRRAGRRPRPRPPARRLRRRDDHQRWRSAGARWRSSSRS